MKFEKIRTYDRRPSFKDAVTAQVRERAAHQLGANGKPAVNIAQAFEEAERAYELMQQPQSKTVVAQVASAPVETLRPLVGLADGVVSVDDLEEELTEIVGPFAGDDEEFTDFDDEEIRVEAAADTALEEAGGNDAVEE
jgi:hypothetical protein